MGRNIGMRRDMFRVCRARMLELTQLELQKEKDLADKKAIRVENARDMGMQRLSHSQCRCNDCTVDQFSNGMAHVRQQSQVE